jgi:hypothetical protein
VGTTKVATAYLEYLYSAEGQKIAAKNYYRPIKPELADAKDVARFPKVNLIRIDELGGWQAAQKKHFSDGGTFDQGLRQEVIWRDRFESPKPVASGFHNRLYILFVYENPVLFFRVLADES